MQKAAIVETQVDSDIEDKAMAVLDSLGMTLSDVLGIVLTRTAKEGAGPVAALMQSAEHDSWFRSQVQKALDDPHPLQTNAEVKEHFAALKASNRHRQAA